jgi:hypothetical protein
MKKIFANLSLVLFSFFPMLSVAKSHPAIYIFEHNGVKLILPAQSQGLRSHLKQNSEGMLLTQHCRNFYTRRIFAPTQEDFSQIVSSCSRPKVL